MNTHVDLRDSPMDPLSERDRFAAAVLERLRNRDDLTTTRLFHGLLSPKEVARVAAEVHLDQRAKEQG